MPRYFGELGYSRVTETAPGVWDDVVTEVSVTGDVEQRTETYSEGGSVLPQYRTTTSISVISRGRDQDDNSDLRYVSYRGKRWTISSVVDRFPRIVIYMGEEYNGPLPDPTP